MFRTLCGALVLTLPALALANCPGQNILARPEDPSERGAYPVGRIGVEGLTERDLRVEVWYPAEPGSQDPGGKQTSYNFRDEHCTEAVRAQIPEDEDVTQVCDCFDGLPIDKDSGPFPVMFYIHGTGGWRTNSLDFVVHWASRGFVVVAADYPGITMLDLLKSTELTPVPATNQPGDTRLLYAEFSALTDHPSLGFLDGLVDMSRVAMSGHSAGGMALERMGDIAQVLIPMAGRGVFEGPALQSTLVLAGRNDTIVSYNSQSNGYANSPRTKRLAALNDSGHQAFSDLCFFGRDRGGIIGIATKYGVWQAFLLGALATDGCDFEGDRFVTPERAWQFINYASSAVLEETLMCDSAMTERLAALPRQFPFTFDYQEEL